MLKKFIYYLLFDEIEHTNMPVFTNEIYKGSDNSALQNFSAITLVPHGYGLILGKASVSPVGGI